MQPLKARIKSFLRWAVLGGTLFFLAKVLKENWQQVISVRIDAAGWACLTISLGVTLSAHISAGWVWHRILQDLQQPVAGVWVIQAYLKTNIAKYLPGNIWHYYGRITAATGAGATFGAATVSVLLEPLLMASAALLMGFVGSQQMVAKYGAIALTVQICVLCAAFGSIHPRILNPLIQLLNQLKQSSESPAAVPQPFTLKHYPIVPLLGEIGFLSLRGTGFLLTFLAIHPIASGDLPLIFSAFCFSWLLGLVIPGAPGGIGVFEATAIGLLGQLYTPAIILSVVALYRLVSVLAEVGGAGLAYLDEQYSGQEQLQSASKNIEENRRNDSPHISS